MNRVMTAIKALFDEAGLLIGDGEKPAAGGQQSNGYVPYSIVGEVPSDTDGSSARPDAVWDLRIQVNSVGVNPTQARVQADKVRTALSGKFIETSDRISMSPISQTRIGKPDRDDAVTPSVYFIADIFVVRLAPKSSS